MSRCSSSRCWHGRYCEWVAVLRSLFFSRCFLSRCLTRELTGTRPLGSPLTAAITGTRPNRLCVPAPAADPGGRSVSRPAAPGRDTCPGSLCPKLSRRWAGQSATFDCGRTGGCDGNDCWKMAPPSPRPRHRPRPVSKVTVTTDRHCAKRIGIAHYDDV